MGTMGTTGATGEGGDPMSASSQDPNTKQSQAVEVLHFNDPKCLKKTFEIFLPRRQGRTASENCFLG